MQNEQDVRTSGIPAVTFVNVQIGYPGERGEIAVDSNAVSVFEAGEASSRHEGYAGVFDKSTTETEVCEGILGPDAAVNPIAACVGDGATILMLVIGSRKTKKHIFNKRTLLPFVCNELFAAIQDKTGTVIGSYETAIKVSAFEIQDEIISDLLRPSNRGLVVQATPEDGIVVVGLTNEMHTTEMSLQRALEGACDNRATHTLPPGGSIDSSSCVWELELIQDEEVAGGSVRHSRSKFIVCEVPATDPLVLDSSDMRQLEGPTLHKSLTTFVDVSKKLTSPQLAAIAPFRSSKLTHYLSEVLGGNAVVMALSQVIPGESKVSRKTLEITSDISQSVHFPITGHDMTGVLRGLLTKYRSLILQLQDEIENGAPIGDVPPELSEKRLSELQAELAQAHILKNQTKEDYTRLYEMMTMLKEKYKTLAEQKATQSQELIKAEEERLNVARALVELKLEHSNLLESAENEKFELSSSLLAAKSEIYDLDAQLVTSKSEAASAKEASYELERLLKAEQQELAASAAALQEVKTQLEKENIKNVELGSELLTLVNQKDELKKSVEQLQQKLDVAAIKLSSAQTEAADKERITNEMREANRALEDEIGELKRAQTDHEIEFKRLVGELDSAKDELDKMTGEFMRERETIYESARTAAEDEIRNAQLETEEIGGMLRKADKRQRDLERTIQRLQFDLESTAEQLIKAQTEADDVREKYRKRLKDLFAPSAVPSGVDPKYGSVGELPLKPEPEPEPEPEPQPEPQLKSNAEPMENSDDDVATEPKISGFGDLMKAAKAKQEEEEDELAVKKALGEEESLTPKPSADDVPHEEGTGDKEDDKVQYSDTDSDKSDGSRKPQEANVDVADVSAVAKTEGDAKEGEKAANKSSEDSPTADSEAGMDVADTEKAGVSDTGAAENDPAVSKGDEEGAISGSAVPVHKSSDNEDKSDAGMNQNEGAETTSDPPEPLPPTEDENVLEALVSSYNEKEESNGAHLEEEKSESRGLKKAYRLLFDKYQKLLDSIEEYDPAHLPPAKDLVDEMELLRSCGVNGELHEPVDNVAEERLKQAEVDFLQFKASTAAMVDSYKNRLRVSEAKVVAISEENAMLRAENQAKTTEKQFEELHAALKAQLERQQDEMLAAQMALQSRSQKNGGEQDFAAAMRQQQKERDEKEAAELAKKKEQEEAAEAARKEAEAKAEVKIAELNEEVSKLKADLQNAQTFAGDMLNADGEVPLAQFNAVRNRLLGVEKDKAERDARIISLEDELKQYNQYMRDSAVMYRRQVASLKQQGRQYAVAMQELQMRYAESTETTAQLKRDIEVYKAGGVPESATPRLELPSGEAVVEAPLESVREDEESEEEEARKKPGAESGTSGNEKTDDEPAISRLNSADEESENEPPSNSESKNEAVPSLKLPDIGDPEVTGHDSERGPASARLDTTDGVKTEAASLIAGAAAEGALESGADPATLLPDLVASPRPDGE